MPNRGHDITGSAIQPIAKVPAAFAGLGLKINELVGAVNAGKLAARSPVVLIAGDTGKLIALDLEALQRLLYAAPQDAAGVSSSGGASGTTVYTLTICVNGSPKSLDVLITAGPY